MNLEPGSRVTITKGPNKDKQGIIKAVGRDWVVVACGGDAYEVPATDVQVKNYGSFKVEAPIRGDYGSFAVASDDPAARQLGDSIRNLPPSVPPKTRALLDALLAPDGVLGGDAN